MSFRYYVTNFMPMDGYLFDVQDSASDSGRWKEYESADFFDFQWLNRYNVYYTENMFKNNTDWGDERHDSEIKITLYRTSRSLSRRTLLGRARTWHSSPLGFLLPIFLWCAVLFGKHVCQHRLDKMDWDMIYSVSVKMYLRDTHRLFSW